MQVFIFFWIQEENSRQKIDGGVPDLEITFDISNSIYIYEPQVVGLFFDGEFDKHISYV